MSTGILIVLEFFCIVSEASAEEVTDRGECDLIDESEGIMVIGVDVEDREQVLIGGDDGDDELGLCGGGAGDVVGEEVDIGDELWGHGACGGAADAAIEADAQATM